MNPFYRRSFLAAVLVAFVAALGAGCQTTKGLGKDVEKLGENIQDGAK